MLMAETNVFLECKAHTVYGIGRGSFTVCGWAWQLDRMRFQTFEDFSRF